MFYVGYQLPNTTLFYPCSGQRIKEKTLNVAVAESEVQLEEIPKRSPILVLISPKRSKLWNFDGI